VDGQRRTVQADLGPVRYLATLLGAGDQDVLRWFILVVALLLDRGRGGAQPAGPKNAWAAFLRRIYGCW
jgi:hypothetical protein